MERQHLLWKLVRVLRVRGRACGLNLPLGGAVCLEAVAARSIGSGPLGRGTHPGRRAVLLLPSPGRCGAPGSCWWAPLLTHAPPPPPPPRAATVPNLQAQPVQEWLRAACEQAAGDDSLDLPDGLTAADWACVREQVGRWGGALRLRWVYLAPPPPLALSVAGARRASC